MAERRLTKSAKSNGALNSVDVSLHAFYFVDLVGFRGWLRPWAAPPRWWNDAPSHMGGYPYMGTPPYGTAHHSVIGEIGTLCDSIVLFKYPPKEVLLLVSRCG